MSCAPMSCITAPRLKAALVFELRLPLYNLRFIAVRLLHGREIMLPRLPDDLLQFLNDGQQLQYDEDMSSIGRIALKRAADLALTTISVPNGCQSIIDDPYSDLNGHYQVQVIDLVAESEDYPTEGLLCWIVALQQFGSIDPEHGDVITFGEASWTDIAAEPLAFLDSIWIDDGVGVRQLPWLHFPFVPSGEGDLVIQPFGTRCPLHRSELTTTCTPKRPLFDVLRRRELRDWVAHLSTTFPCAGVPVNEHEVLCCNACRKAEDAWLQAINDSIVSMNATQNEHGWIQCPGCGTRFSASDSQRFANGIHLSCGQKITLIS